MSLYLGLLFILSHKCDATLYKATEAVVQEEEVEDVVAVVVVDLALAIIVRNVVQVSETRTPMNHQQQSNT